MIMLVTCLWHVKVMLQLLAHRDRSPGAANRGESDGQHAFLQPVASPTSVFLTIMRDIVA